MSQFSLTHRKVLFMKTTRALFASIIALGLMSASLAFAAENQPPSIAPQATATPAVNSKEIATAKAITTTPAMPSNTASNKDDKNTILVGLFTSFGDVAKPGAVAVSTHTMLKSDFASAKQLTAKSIDAAALCSVYDNGKPMIGHSCISAKSIVGGKIASNAVMDSRSKGH